MMKKILLSMMVVLFAINLQAQDLMITGIFDGPMPGGKPKVLELYAINDIADLSVYTVQNQTNANTEWGNPFSLSGSASAGDFIYITGNSQTAEFNTYFENSITPIESGVVNVNGDDRLAIFNADVMIDVFGVDGVDGSGSEWEYLDGWAYRNNNSTPNATFNAAEWTYSGINANDDQTSNATAPNPFPIGTYTNGGVASPSLSITNPANNAVITTTDVNIEFVVSNFVISSDGSGDGYLTYTLDANAAVNHQTTNPIALTGLSEEAHTFVLELVDNSGNSLSPAVSKTINFTVNTNVPPVEFVSIHDIQYTTDASGDSPMKDQVVSTKGLVTAVKDSKFWMQDGAGEWNSIYVFNTATAPAIGDSVMVTGTVVEYYTATQIGTVTEMTILNSGNTPQVANITTAEANQESYESVLVKVEGTNNGAVDQYGQWPINDGSGNILIDDFLFAYTPTQGNSYQVTGIATYSFSERKILPRSAEDIVDLGVSDAPAISITSPANNSTIYTDAVDVEFTVSNFTLGTDGKIAYAIDGGTVEYQITNNNITFTGLTDGSHTVNLELVDMSNASLNPAATTNVTFTVNLAGPTITPIHDIQYTTDASGDSPLKDQTLTVKGVVSGNFNGTQYGKGYYVQDGAGAWNSLYIFDQDHTPNIGDSVMVTGKVVEFNGMTEMKNVTDFQTIGIGGNVAEPILITTAAVAEEQYESCLIKVENAECTEANGQYGKWKVNDGSGDAVCKDNGAFTFTEELGTKYNIIGLINFSFGESTINYRIESDIEIANGIDDNFALDVNIYPNPANSIINFVNLNQVKNIEIINMTGQTLMSEKVRNNTMTLNIENLSSGVYMVKLTSNNKFRVIRIEKF